MKFVKREDKKVKAVLGNQLVWFETGGKTFIFHYKDQTLKEYDKSMEYICDQVSFDRLYEGDELTFKL